MLASDVLEDVVIIQAEALARDPQNGHQRVEQFLSRLNSDESRLAEVLRAFEGLSAATRSDLFDKVMSWKTDDDPSRRLAFQALAMALGGVLARRLFESPDLEDDRKLYDRIRSVIYGQAAEEPPAIKASPRARTTKRSQSSAGKQLR
ncbi:MAG: hypothetical protein IPK72_23775 [Candidatus Eisenbacteria bacterium]|nr:hypothetical protein [Candidatus Eisenbacteria bacterium]